MYQTRGHQPAAVSPAAVEAGKEGMHQAHWSGSQLSGHAGGHLVPPGNEEPGTARYGGSQVCSAQGWHASAPYSQVTSRSTAHCALTRTMICGAHCVDSQPHTARWPAARQLTTLTQAQAGPAQKVSCTCCAGACDALASNLRSCQSRPQAAGKRTQTAANPP